MAATAITDPGHLATARNDSVHGQTADSPNMPTAPSTAPSTTLPCAGPSRVRHRPLPDVVSSPATPSTGPTSASASPVFADRPFGHSHHRSSSLSSSSSTSSSSSSAPRFPRISRPVPRMRPSYDVVVIGSGYGGAVAAARMARAGQSVCVLEVGRERWPGEYPTSTADAVAELHCAGALGTSSLPKRLAVSVAGAGPAGPTSMFRLLCGEDQNALVCHGLGGTSLINANIFLRADANTMTLPAWPPELRRPHALDPYYAAVEAVLEPAPYPADWPALAKLTLLQRQAAALGMADRFSRPPQTTRFRDGPSSCGVPMAASTLSGQDCTGVNDGSKTTTLVTYLADAWNWGAELFCECEVRYVEEAGDDEPPGYRVFFAWHGARRDRFPESLLYGDLLSVHARSAVFFGAGALGTTEILLRSRAQGRLRLSPCIGQNMSGNGDLLAFACNTDNPVHAIGQVSTTSRRTSPVGPTITGVIDHRDPSPANPLDGFVIEEGAVPHALAGFLKAMLAVLPHDGDDEVHGVKAPSRTRRLARWASRLFSTALARGTPALDRTEVFLAMAHDSNQAVLALRDDQPVLTFAGAGRSDRVRTLTAILGRAAAAVGGALVGNPFSVLDEQLTVHPLGGAAIAADGTGATGATDHRGRLFTGNGRTVHPGLLVVDGAAVPTALGVNPLATIAALAERAVALHAASRGLVARTERNGLLDLFGAPAHQCGWGSDGKDEDAIEVAEAGADAVSDVKSEAGAAGFAFTEVMTGFLHACTTPSGAGDADKPEAYDQAARTAAGRSETARVFLTAQARNTARLVRSRRHAARLTGTFACPALHGSPFVVRQGALGLFVRVDADADGTRRLTYDFDLEPETAVDGDGSDTDTTPERRLHFHGFKRIDASVALAPRQLWHALTTLYVTITATTPGHTGPVVVARGILSLHLADLVAQLRTWTPTGRTARLRTASTARLIAFFCRHALGALLAPLAPLQYPLPPRPLLARHHNRGCLGIADNLTPPTRVWTDVRAADGIASRLYLWEPADAYVVRRDADGAPPALLFLPGAAVDHQIFAAPTIAFNAVNYFTRAGYRVFVAVLRIGRPDPETTVAGDYHGWTTFDARLDVRAALETIRGDNADPLPVYVVAHCMGALALAAALLDGTVPTRWLRGVCASQVFLHPVWSPANRLKAAVGPVPADALYRALAGPWFACAARRADVWVQRALNQALRLSSFFTAAAQTVSSPAESCRSATCHRVALIFGRCWNHANLNAATHRRIDRYFGGVHMDLLHLLLCQGRCGRVLANPPACTPLTTTANIRARLRGLPVALFVGADNAVLAPRATEQTYEALCDAFGVDGSVGGVGRGVDPAGTHIGNAFYTRRVIPGYGHLDCWLGRNAWRDVFPLVRADIDRVVHGPDYRFREPDSCVCPFTRMMEEGGL